MHSMNVDSGTHAGIHVPVGVFFSISKKDDLPVSAGLFSRVLPLDRRIEATLRFGVIYIYYLPTRSDLPSPQFHQIEKPSP
jgi:hypothetical protein